MFLKLVVVLLLMTQVQSGEQPQCGREPQREPAVLYRTRVSSGGYLKYTRSMEVFQDVRSPRTTTQPWYEFRYVHADSHTDEVVTSYMIPNEVPDLARLEWDIVAAESDGTIAVAVFNEDGYCWAEAWERTGNRQWQRIGNRVRNSDGRGAEGPRANRARIEIKRDREVAVTVHYVNGDTNELRLVLARSASRPTTRPIGLPFNDADFVSPWQNLGDPSIPKVN
jgi:hypothetical protein